jgi:hypothetical protein
VRSILVRIATTTVAALTLVLGAASPVQAAGLGNCNDPGATTPCFEKIWSDGVQVKMIFVDLNPKPSNAPTEKFYVMAPQTGTPQGSVSPQHDDRDGRVRYHGYFVLCSAQGISSGGCVATITSIPGFGPVPFAKTVNGHKLTSADPIESPANSGFLTLFDTGGELIATINPRQEDESR